MVQEYITAKIGDMCEIWGDDQFPELFTNTTYKPNSRCTKFQFPIISSCFGRITISCNDTPFEKMYGTKTKNSQNTFIIHDYKYCAGIKIIKMRGRNCEICYG